MSILTVGLNIFSLYVGGLIRTRFIRTYVYNLARMQNSKCKLMLIGCSGSNNSALFLLDNSVTPLVSAHV